MMKVRLFLMTALLAVATACGRVEEAVPETRGIYHWKTTFNLTDEDMAFLDGHKINRLYIRMFDVGMEMNEDKGKMEAAPLGTTRFISPVPDKVDVIPTVYITLQALKSFSEKESELADLIVKRVLAMASWNGLGMIKEIQYDCDWTSTTKDSFARLCDETIKLLADKGIILSGTIRLHQLAEATYPFDRGVLMVYNIGSFESVATSNSILDYDDVSKYLSVDSRMRKFRKARKFNCSIIDIAYPTFGWGVVFDDKGSFRRLVSDIGSYEPAANEKIRVEKSDYSEVMKVKSLVDKVLGEVIGGNVIYHLDARNLKDYKDEEIGNILD